MITAACILSGDESHKVDNDGRALVSYKPQSSVLIDVLCLFQVSNSIVSEVFIFELDSTELICL